MLLTPAQVAERLQVTTRTIRAWVRQGRLTPVRLGARSMRFEPAEIARFIEDHTDAEAAS